jgi:hypothetical protein
MDISKGFDGGIHAIGAVVFMLLALVLYKYIYQNTQQLSVFPKLMHWVAFQEVHQMEQASLF